MGKTNISMAMFNSYVTNYQRVIILKKLKLPLWFDAANTPMFDG